MGRIGRLALRAAMGAAERQTADPRAGNRLEGGHLNELKGGAAAEIPGASWAWTWSWNEPASS
ncbi:MAG TPA: hypothetical protein PLF79_13425 [Thauera sp.]|uniref:hypothetical protein n=1 Tax=Thauera sp. TaxID=1905334 RepID=UPI002D0F8943|nr:hypothetical protein [Thauera sp.]HRP23214.1 hypothetical protein [Thauera sp.]HRP67075.1 hypothetical protein [Thauera sp.]